MTRLSPVLLTVFLAVVLGFDTGCIRSRLEITSEPPGADVRVERIDRGTTPASVDFIWYWHYEIELRKDGYELVRAVEHLRTPPWFIFPLDLLAELMPFDIPDVRKRHYVLPPLAANDEGEGE